MEHDIFISYSSKNQQAAEDICSAFERSGIKCWMAQRDTPVLNYAAVITDAVKSAKAVVLIFSKEAAKSQWVEKEINIAVDNRKAIVPYMIDNVRLKDYGGFYLMLNNLQWIQSDSDHNSSVTELISMVSKIIGMGNREDGGDADGKKKKTKRKRWVKWVVIAVIAYILFVAAFIALGIWAAIEESKVIPDGLTATEYLDMGYSYLDTEEYDLAGECILKSARMGHAEAQLAYAEICEQWYNDTNTAYGWYLKSAEQGNAEAMYRVGIYCANGIGLSAPNNAIAVEWFKLSAELEHPEAIFALYECYAEGRGVLQNPEIAHKYLVMGAEAGVPYLQFKLGEYYEKEGHEEHDYTKAVEWYRKSAAADCTEAQVGLAMLYLDGRGVEKNKFEMAKLFDRAAELGNADAQFYVASLYKEGIVHEKNKGKAIEWYRKAANQGHVSARNELNELGEAW